jgi:hypothetical protein
VRPVRFKDVTGALRARRYRQRRKVNETKAGVTVDAPGVTAISTPEMCALAARVGDGRASREDLRMAERLIMNLVDRLPPDSVLDVP